MSTMVVEVVEEVVVVQEEVEVFDSGFRWRPTMVTGAGDRDHKNKFHVKVIYQTMVY